RRVQPHGDLARSRRRWCRAADKNIVQAAGLLETHGFHGMCPSFGAHLGVGCNARARRIGYSKAQLIWSKGAWRHLMSFARSRRAGWVSPNADLGNAGLAKPYSISP